MADTSYSTTGLRDRDVEAALDAIADAGFEYTEIFGQAPHVSEPPTGQALHDFRQRMRQRGLAARTVHAPFRVQVLMVLASLDEALRRRTVALYAKYLRFTGEVGAPDMVVHPAGNSRREPEADDPYFPSRMADSAKRSLDELVPVAADAGVRMLLENLCYGPDCVLTTMDQLRPLVDAYPAEQVGLVIDTGHAWSIGLDPAEAIRTAGVRLGGTHLQDVPHDEPQDNHWIPTYGELDWDAIRAALADVEYRGTWTFEVVRPRHDESPEQLVRLTRQVARQWGM